MWRARNEKGKDKKGVGEEMERGKRRKIRTKQCVNVYLREKGIKRE